MARPSSGGSEPSEFCCPISEDIMEDPVVLIQSGQTYDRKNIEEWFRKGNSTCPNTGMVLDKIQLTSNFALKAAIQNWRQRQAAAPARTFQNGDFSYPQLKPTMYPELAKDDRPQDKIAQVLAAIQKLRSGSLDDKVFREQRIYELWTLSELMTDPYCCDEFINHSLLPLVARFLAEDNSAGCKAAAARILQRLALTPAASQVYNTLHPDGIANLVRMLSVPDPATLNRPSCREAAATALRDLAPISRPAHDEIVFQLCKRSKELGAANPSFVAPLTLLFQVPANADSVAAAELIGQITKSTPLQDYKGYSSCQGSQAIPSLVSLLATADARHAAVAKAALTALLYTSNQPSIVYQLLQGLGSQDRASREAAGVLLWEVAAGNVNLVAVITSTPNFAPCLEQSLRGRSLAGAGLVQLVTCDHPRPTNSVVAPPNTDATRMQLVSHPQVLPSLVELLHTDETLTITAALHALANLTAFRSSTSSHDFRLRRASTSDPYIAHPSAMVAASEALPRLMALLNCQDPVIVAPALALLNNLVAENDNRDKVREASKQWGQEAWKTRLEGLMGWVMLPDKCRTAARSALQRLQAGRLERSPEHFNLITLMMRPP